MRYSFGNEPVHTRTSRVGMCGCLAVWARSELASDVFGVEEAARGANYVIIWL